MLAHMTTMLCVVSRDVYTDLPVQGLARTFPTGARKDLF